MLPLFLLYLLLILALPLAKWRPASTLYRYLTAPTALWVLLATVIGWWIVRNILHV